MKSPSQSLDDTIRGLAENFRSVRFGSGVVGKTSYATIALIVVWGGIVWRLSDNVILDVALMIAGLVATGLWYWWVKGTQQFARENPGLALLEGAQLLEYQRFDAQIKGLGEIKNPKIIPGPSGMEQIEKHNDDERSS